MQDCYNTGTEDYNFIFSKPAHEEWVFDGKKPLMWEGNAIQSAGGRSSAFLF